MWISDHQGNMVNLDYVREIFVDECSVYAIGDNDNICLSSHDTKDQAKARVSQIRQLLRNNGQFVNID